MKAFTKLKPGESLSTSKSMGFEPNESYYIKANKEFIKGEKNILNRVNYLTTNPIVVTISFRRTLNKHIYEGIVYYHEILWDMKVKPKSLQRKNNKGEVKGVLQGSPETEKEINKHHKWEDKEEAKKIKLEEMNAEEIREDFQKFLFKYYTAHPDIKRPQPLVAKKSDESPNIPT